MAEQSGFNGATTFRSWKLALLPRPPETFDSFNGATTFRSWKHAASLAFESLAGASMGPRPFDRGNGLKYPSILIVSFWNDLTRTNGYRNGLTSSIMCFSYSIETHLFEPRKRR